MAETIIGFIGKLASGKGTACNYLKEKHSAETLMFSQSLRDILKRLYLEHTRENMQVLSQILREHFGQETLARAVALDAQKSLSNLVAVDGIRRPKDLEFLRQMPNFILIYIEADQLLRYERILHRGQNPGESAEELSFGQFQKNESAEAESLIDDVAKEAKYKINNNGSFEEFYSQIEYILKEKGI